MLVVIAWSISLTGFFTAVQLLRASRAPASQPARPWARLQSVRFAGAPCITDHSIHAVTAARNCRTLHQRSFCGNFHSEHATVTLTDLPMCPRERGSELATARATDPRTSPASDNYQSVSPGSPSEIQRVSVVITNTSLGVSSVFWGSVCANHPPLHQQLIS